jgi:pilus assembly protein CpaB
MRARSVALLLLALGCGLVASIGITQVIGSRNAESTGPTGDTVPIFLVMEDVARGEPLTAQVLRLEPWPKDKVPAGALSRAEDVEGRRTRAPIYAGEPVVENRLYPKGSGEAGYTMMIPKGFRAIAVKVNRDSGSGLILPGDRVDLLMHLRRDPNRGILQETTRTILQDVKVFAVNDVVETEEEGEKTITAQTISLLLTPKNAQDVVQAEKLGTIRLIMRSPEDDEITVVADSTPAELLDIAEVGGREEEEPVPPIEEPSAGEGGFLEFLNQLRAGGELSAGGASEPTAGTTHRMQIVSGSNFRNVILQKDTPDSDTTEGPQRWQLIDQMLPSDRPSPDVVPMPAPMPPPDEPLPPDEEAAEDGGPWQEGPEEESD